jgi:hypothetical protein
VLQLHVSAERHDGLQKEPVGRRNTDRHTAWGYWKIEAPKVLLENSEVEILLELMLYFI